MASGMAAAAAGSHRRCGLYTKKMISKVYRGSSYIEFKNFLKQSHGGDSFGEGGGGEDGGGVGGEDGGGEAPDAGRRPRRRLRREQLNNVQKLKAWKETIKTLNFCPAHFDSRRRPIPAVIYKNNNNEIFIDILLHNSTGDELYVQEKMLGVTVSKIPYPNCLCDMCIRRLLFQQQRTTNHVKRMILLDGSVYWVTESGVNLQRMLMTVEERECCMRTEFGFPFWLYPQMRCAYSVCEPELYNLVWLDSMPDASYIVNPSIVCNQEATWLAGEVYLVTPNCQKYKVLGGIPAILCDILLTFVDMSDVWVIVVKDGYVFSICLMYHDGVAYVMEEVYTDENFFV